MNGRQSVPSDTSFRINRTDLFPYVFLSRKIMKIAGFELRGFLIHRRSISRPAYEYLNPFPRFVDQYLYEAGNPSLRPQFTRNYEFNISAGDYPILSIGRNDIRDIFTNVIYEDPRVPSVAYRTYDNLGKNRETYFRAVGALPPGGKYFFVLGTQYNHNEYTGLYENKPIAFSRGSWTFFTYHQLRIDKRSTLSLNGFMRLKGQLQFYELSNFGGLSMSVNRLFFDRKLTVTLNANDIFFTNRNSFSIKQGNIEAFGKRQNDTRRVGVNVRYNFGLKKREERNNPFNIEEPGGN
jgi:iron complex outermembrane recepter protein